jgi:hypothetical protein
MPVELLEYAIFPLILFFLGAALVSGLPLAVEFYNHREGKLHNKKFAKADAHLAARAATAGR